MDRTRSWQSLWWCALLAACVTACQSTEGVTRSKAQAVDLIEQADRSFELGSFVEALELYKLASVAARNERSEVHFTEAAAQVSSTLSVMGQPDEGSNWLTQAKVGDDGKDPAAHSRVLFASALSLRDRGQDQAALSVFASLFQWTMEHQLWGRAMQASTMASVLATGEERLAWSLKALEAAAASKERPWKAAAYQSLGFVYEERGDFAEAVNHLQLARDLNPAGSRERLHTEWALAHNLRLAGEIEEAGQILTRLIPAAKAFHARGFAGRDAEWLGRCQEELGELLAGRQQWVAALRALGAARQAYQLAEMQERAPRKWRALEARIAEIKMLRIQAERRE